MSGPLSFPGDSRDQIEHLYAEDILQHFPAYSHLWETFIGRRAGHEDLVPYELSFPESFSASDERTIRHHHHLLALVHYAIFLDLAGAHHQWKVAREVESNAPPETKLFLFVEALTGFYHHLGAVYYKLKGRLVPTVGAIRRTCRYEPASMGRGSRVHELVTSLGAMPFLTVRDNHVHTFRAFLGKEMPDGKFVLIEPLERSPSPLPTARSRGRPWIAIPRMALTLEKVEIALDMVDTLLIEDLKGSFDVAGIAVDYDSGG